LVKEKNLKMKVTIFLILSVMFLTIKASSYSGPLPDNGISMTLEEETDQIGDIFKRFKKINPDSCYVDCTYFNKQISKRFGVSVVGKPVLNSDKLNYCWDLKFQAVSLLKHKNIFKAVEYNLNLVNFLYSACEVLE
jgi:hypothetical protein